MKNLLMGKAIVTAALIASAGLTTDQAQAATIIELTDGVTTVTVVDGGFGDLSATPGVVVFSGAVGVFDVNVTTGLSYPLLGAINQPSLNLDSVNVNSSGTGTLTVKLTTTDYVGPGVGTATLETGGTTDGSIYVQSFVDDSNAAFGTDDLTGTLGIYQNGAFSGSTFGFTGLGAPYSATIIATITHNNPLDVTSFDADYNIVPEPGSIALIALGAGMLTYRRRRSA